MVLSWLILGLGIGSLICASSALHILTDGTATPRTLPSLNKGQESPDVDPSLQAELPIRWMHAPRTGTSIVNTLMHVPGLCPGVPKDLVLDGGARGWLHDFLRMYPTACNTSAWDPQTLDHYDIERFPGGWDAGKGHFMMFTRDPEQRLLSFGSTTWIPHEQVGCITKMMVRAPTATKTNCYDGPPPTNAELEEAKYRQRTGFAFIGDTNRWDLSMCLFNRMFNQACHSHQFVDTRPSYGREQSTYDTTVLNGWRDPYDHELYDIAKGIFESNLEKYNVSDISCEPCWRQAGIL